MDVVILGGIPVGFVRDVTRANVICHGADYRLSSKRGAAYYKAYKRRLARELEQHGEYGDASPCLLVLSSRLVDYMAGHAPV